MLRMAADENFNNHVVRGLLDQLPTLDLLRVQDAGLSGADDPAILAWAAEENRVLLTHDVRTMTRYALKRVKDGLEMPGIVEVKRSVPIGRAIDDLVLLAECSLEREWQGQILYLPL